MNFRQACCFARMAFALLAVCGTASAQQPSPNDKAAWIEKLSKIKESPTTGLDYQTLYALTQAEPETIYAVLRESWTRLASDKARMYLIQMFINNNGPGIRIINGKIEETGQVNPHLIDILHLGATDSSPDVQKATFQALYTIAYQDFTNLDSYKAWRQKSEGKSALEIVGENSRQLTAKLAQADDKERILLYEQMMRQPYYTGSFSTTNETGVVRGFYAIGLTGVRRKAMLEAHLLDTVVDSLRAGKPANLKERALRFLARFHPDTDQLRPLEAHISREMPAMLMKQQGLDYEVMQFVGSFKGRWAGDILLKMLAKEEMTPQSYILTDALAENGDPRSIPTLIAMYESVDPKGYQGQSLERALTKITQTPYRFDADHDGDWWRVWWRQNRAKFPEEARNTPFPKIGESRAINGYLSLRRRKSRHDIADDPRRVYWLISPGILTLPAEGAQLPAAGADRNPVELPKSARPGLIVVLEEGNVNDEARKEFWMQAALKAFESHYLIALVVPPQWKPDQAVPWVTAGNRSRVPEATFTTESFVREIVKDIQANYPINPDRIYLHGEGAAGPAAYACSLERETPFQGAWLLAAPFRSAQLPLSQAKGRRYYIQHSKEDKVSPFYLAAAAQELLLKQGATVKLAAYKGAHGYQFEGDKWEPFQTALAWLESNKK